MDKKVVTPAECFVYNFPGLRDRAFELAEELVRHKSNYIGATMQNIADEIAAGRIVIYIIDEDGLDVWFATKVEQNSTGVRELVILALKGTGVFKHGAKLLSTWYEIAKHNNCQFLWTQTSEPGVARVLRKFKFMPVSETYVHAVPDGKQRS